MAIDEIEAALTPRLVRTLQNANSTAADENVTRLLGRVVGRSLCVQAAVTSLRTPVPGMRLLPVLIAVTALRTHVPTRAASRPLSENARLPCPENAHLPCLELAHRRPLVCLRPK